MCTWETEALENYTTLLVFWNWALFSCLLHLSKRVCLSTGYHWRSPTGWNSWWNRQNTNTTGLASMSQQYVSIPEILWPQASWNNSFRARTESNCFFSCQQCGGTKDNSGLLQHGFKLGRFYDHGFCCKEGHAFSSCLSLWSYRSLLHSRIMRKGFKSLLHCLKSSKLRRHQMQIALDSMTQTAALQDRRVPIFCIERIRNRPTSILFFRYSCCFCGIFPFKVIESAS